ncbi:hypothetical protein [Rhizobium sp. AN80A]|uniref:hypothetical protein n=1 Tax=Rhizobium sp. AN80A TaxID=3040673 RepID=UPI0024B33399|nr:hypothetical protein [Rhizobium sp. AN80A]
MSITRIPASLLSGGSGSAASAFINPESYGMKAVGVAGASAALNKAALEAALAAGPVLLPPKTYDITGIVFTGRMVLIGCGMTSVLNVTSTGAGSAGIHVLIPAPNVGTILRDFAITAPVANACIHGIKFEQTHADGFMANWEISGIYLWQTFASAAIYLDNHIASGDGFFTGIIEKCRMTTGSDAGILGQLIGDSIIIRKNTISDGIGVAINCSQVSGARQLIIEDNNLTSRNGQIYLGACAQAIVNRNWCEHPAYLGEFVGPPAILSQITLADCPTCVRFHTAR